MNFNHVHGDCYVSFNDIQWLLIKVTGRETVSTKPLSNFESNSSCSIKNCEACVVTTLPVIFFLVASTLSCEC
jgi:hypothetical protein